MFLISIFLLFFIIMLYVLSCAGAGSYFDKKRYTFKIIYLIAVFTPIWNTYLLIKYISSDFDSIKETIKYHFTWDEE